MSKIQVTLDASKLRGLVANRSYQNKQGETVTVQEVKFELVAVKDPKVIYSAEKYEIQKTHFASVIQTKEEREANTPTVFIGEGFTTVWKNEQTYHATPIDPTQEEEHDDLPF